MGLKQMFESLPKVFTTYKKAEEWANSQSFKDGYSILKDDGFLGLAKNGIELIPAVHESYEDLMEEWIMIEPVERAKPNKFIELNQKEDNATQTQRAMYEGFDEECGF